MSKSASKSPRRVARTSPNRRVSEIWPLANTPRWFVWLTIVGWLLTWWLLNYANQLRIDKLPRLGILFDETAAPYIHPAHFNKDVEDQAIFVSVLPRALTDTPIRACKDYLNSVMREGENREWEATSFDHRQQLLWGAAGLQPALEADIDSETNQALSVFPPSRVQ